MGRNDITGKEYVKGEKSVPGLSKAGRSGGPFAFCPWYVLTFDADGLEDAIQGGESWVPSSRERAIQGFSIDNSGGSYFAELVGFGNVTQGQHKNGLRLVLRGIEIGSDVFRIFQSFLKSNFIRS
jgi:hypothetical protein